MSWYVYNLSPIDMGWNNLKTVKETVIDLAKDGFFLESKEEIDSDILLGFIHDWEAAQKLAKSFGWEGDFAESPAVIWLPTPEYFRFVYAFAIKQSNNGTTYVISPVPMTWLGEEE